MIYAYLHKAEINLDYFQIQSQLNRALKELKFLVFVETSYMSVSGEMDDWLGLVDAVKKMMIKEGEKIRNRFVKIQDHVEEQSNLNKSKQNYLEGVMRSVHMSHRDIL